MKKLLSLLLIIVTSVQAQGIGVSFGPGPGMSHGAVSTAPTIATTNTGVDTTSATTVSVNMPASVATGDLLMVFSGMLSTVTGITMTGWTCTTEAPASVVVLGWCYRVADGTEGATQTVTWTTSSRARFIAIRITGQTSNTPESTAAACGTSSGTPDGGSSMAPSWTNTAATLYLSVIGLSANASISVSTVPSGYSTGVINAPGTAAAVALAYKQATSVSDDPGTWTTNTAAWGCKSLAVKGS